MIQHEKQAAIVTAGERLEAIETWMRRTFVASLVIAHLTAVLAAAALYGGYEYMRIKSAVSEAQAKFAKGMEDLRAPTPARKAVDTSDLRDTKAELAQVVLNTRTDLEKIARDMRLQYETNAMTFDLKTRKQLIKFYEDTARKAADDRVEQMRP